MRTPQDILQSLQRYTAGILPEPWDVRIALEAAPPQRPFALVTQNSPATPSGKWGAHSLLWQAAYTVHAYLPGADTRKGADLASAQLMESFIYAFKVVGNAPSTRGDVVPLWDFMGDTTGGVEPPRGHCDYATIEQFQTRPITDPADPRLQTVVVDLTLDWWRVGSAWDQGSPLTGAVRADPQTPLTRVEITAKPEGV